MTQLQQVVFELEMDYAGHPYYVSGNAILHAIAQRVDYQTQQQIRVSHGFFAPGQFGKYPSWHSNKGTRPYMGSSLPDVDSYADLFLCRDPSQQWLLDTRARDALNTHDVKLQADSRPVLGRKTVVATPEEGHKGHTTTWYIHAYIHATDDSVLPLSDATLDGLQFGGARNYGYGETQLNDTQVVDLDALDYSALTDADSDEYLLKLVTPYVLQSDHPHADDNTPPVWWECDTDRLRRRTELIMDQNEAFDLTTVDHGQVVGHDGQRLIETAKNGLTRIGSHAKYGFGEYRLIPES